MAYKVAAEQDGIRKMEQTNGENTRYEMDDRVITVFRSDGKWHISCTSPDYGSNGGEKYVFSSFDNREQAHKSAKRVAKTPLDEFEATSVDGGL